MITTFKKGYSKVRESRKSFIIFFLALLIAGCASSQNDLNTVTVWHWMSDRDDAFQELAKRYEEQTGVKVRFDLYAPSDAYSQRIKASAQTSTLPDIYGILGEKRDFASFIKSGHVANLAPQLNQETNGVIWRRTFFERALSVNEFEASNEYGVEPGIYGVPLDVTTIQMVYNKKLYQQAGLNPNNPPATWEQFVAHSKALRDKNIPRFVSGFGEIWMIDALASNYAMNIMGEKKVFDTYRGTVSYTDPDWIKVLNIFQQMAAEKILADGAVTMVNKTAEQTFANEKAAYAFNGSWGVNVYKGMNPNLDYAAIPPPKYVTSNPMKIWGGAGSSFVVNEKSPRKEQAIAFLKWLTAADQQAYFATQTENLPANSGALTQVNPILAQFADDMDASTHPNIYPVHENPKVTEAFDKGIQSILIGEKTPEQVASEVQKIKEKELAKK